MNIQEYRPQLEIEFFDGTFMYVDAELKDTFFEQINLKTFVEINGEIVNARREIRRARIAKDSDLFKTLNKKQIQIIHARIKKFRENLARFPSREEVRNIILKAQAEKWPGFE